MTWAEWCQLASKVGKDMARAEWERRQAAKPDGSEGDAHATPGYPGGDASGQTTA